MSSVLALLTHKLTDCLRARQTAGVAVSLEGQTYTYTAAVPAEPSPDQVYTYATSTPGENTYSYSTSVLGENLSAVTHVSRCFLSQCLMG